MNQPSIRAAVLLVLPVSLAGCGEPAEDEATPQQTENPLPVEPGGGIGDGARPPADANPDAARTAAIPPTMQGRWGLMPADCESDVAQGLLTVGPTRLTFYESVGELGSVSARSDDRIRGTFAFTGEGMTWTRDLSLTLEDGGRTLIRRDHDGEASPGAFKYTRCS